MKPTKRNIVYRHNNFVIEYDIDEEFGKVDKGERRIEKRPSYDLSILAWVDITQMYSLKVADEVLIALRLGEHYEHVDENNPSIIVEANVPSPFLVD